MSDHNHPIYVRFLNGSDVPLATSIQLELHPVDRRDRRGFNEAVMKQLMPPLVGYVLEELWDAVKLT